ncbi:hypothetical protein [Sphingomonas sp.]|uniref:hypothetical protein n=1 Tax=Sphingomonas sp. TaxID=28214 RepID=UPI002DD62695|nr:hypothetical protein [Sphingomonas sp.]
MAITDFIKALTEARDRIASLNLEIGELEAKRHAIAMTPPHTDDIIAAYMRGLDTAVAEYERRLGWYLNAANVTKPYAADTVSKGEPRLLTVPPGRPGIGHEVLFHNSQLSSGGHPVDPAAITYFMRDVIAERIPGLVSKYVPGAEQGLRQADREAALREVDTKLGLLIDERDALLASLGHAREAAEPTKVQTLQ